VAKETEQKHLRDDKRRQRRKRKLARRQKLRRPAKMATNHLPLTELDKYSREADELASRLEQLAAFHEHRSGLAREAEALKATRDRANEAILDAEGPADVLAENLRGLEGEKLLLQASLDALSPRIEASEVALQNALAPAGARFERLRGYLLAQALSRAVGRIAALLEPAARQLPEAAKLAEHELEYAQAASLRLPSASGWATARPLNEVPVPFGNMARPYSAAEIAENRSQTVLAIKTCAAALVEAARKIIRECEAFGPEGVPEFELPEPAAPSPAVPPEWNEGLLLTDREFIARHCEEAGKDPANLSDRDKEVLAALVEERRRMPQSHGMVLGPMIGSTTDGRSWKEPV
jgi:hypothetical protein